MVVFQLMLRLLWMAMVVGQRQKGLTRLRGHEEGINSVRAVVEASGEVGIKVLTLYTFSKENWRRPKREITGLWKLLIQTVKT